MSNYYTEDGKHRPITPRKTHGRFGGARGRITIRHKGSLEGWHHTQSEAVRHKHLDESLRKHGYAETERKLNALTILEENRDPAVARAASEDKRWLESNHRE